MGRLLGMGVTAYTGLWASGKTLWLSDECLRLQAQGVLIATNFGFYSEDYSLQTVDDWLRLVASQLAVPVAERRRIHFALDELGMLFTARDFGNFPAALNVIFLQGRKFKVSLSYTVQDFALVDANIRRVTARVVKCRGHGRKLISAKGEPPEYRPVFFSRAVYLAEEQHRARASRIGFSVNRLPLKPAAAYDTYALIATAQAVLTAQVASLRDAPVIVVAPAPAQ